MPVGHVVVQHAGSLLATDGAPEQTGGVDAHAEDQRWRDEAWIGRGLLTESRAKGQNTYQYDFWLSLYPHRQTKVHFYKNRPVFNTTEP